MVRVGRNSHIWVFAYTTVVIADREGGEGALLFIIGGYVTKRKIAGQTMVQC